MTVAILYCYKRFNPPYLKIMPFYLLVSIGIEILVNRFINQLLDFRPFADQADARVTLYNLFTPFELIIFSYFLYQVIRSPMVKKMVLILVCLFAIFFVQYSLQNGLGYSNDIAVVLESVIIIIPCLTYFRELLAWNEPVNLLREPSFWLVTGIFFYLATIIPLYMTRSYLIAHGFTGVAKSLYSINNFALSITYLLFIRSYTCRIRKL
ncbi:hypothetical protein Q4E93_03830 [Flavitalea sp. BT771]|uniref:hypothetical protein n=1 Tax=Flavitalea sp. BT771 TaxID=3063329 RepID=UPI0026E2028B|nr:hypothetical protein [Flavitalea sp. BT771]MDO6429696.1 hypothetical protein [Flavitalea sp. BT771]MDV6218176.1 hypothetical protein [Flavitalea sp. BT771]